MATNFPDSASPAVQFVQDAHNTFLGKADESVERAIRYAEALANFRPLPLQWNVDFNFNAGLTPFVRPAAPTFSQADYVLHTPDVPSTPPAFEAQTPEYGELPEWTESAPVLSFSPKPAQQHIARPVAPGKPFIPAMPVEPDYEVPQAVSLISLNLPAMPSIVIPEFTSQRPTLPAFNINDDFSRFEPRQYASDLLADLKGRVRTWLRGEEALPASIERALFGRGRARIEVERQAQEQQVFDDFVARGFSAPNGLLAGRLDGVRQKAQDQLAEFNRDAMLKSFDEALANMRLAVQEGIQLEGVAVNLHMEQQRLEMQALSHLRDTAIAILNARIAYFNAESEGVRIEAQVFEARLRGELAKLDVLRAQLEAEKLKGDMNQQTVDLYRAQWDAVRTMAAWYGERVTAVKTQIDAARLPIEIFAEETRAFEAMWGARAKELDGWKAEIEGEEAKVSLYKTSADAYASRVQGVVSMSGMQNDRERLRIAQHGQLLEQFGMQLRRVDQFLQGEQARLAAVAQRDRARADVFQAQASVEQAASDANDRHFNSLLAAARARVDVELEEARTKSTENTQILGLVLEAMKTMAQVQAQLAASSMSAVNYSAGVSASDSFSRGRSVSWSGEAPDFNGTEV